MVNNYTKNSKVEKNYNNEEKNKVRNKIIDFINLYNIKKILTLESSEFLFSKLIPHKKIYVYEYNKTIFETMKRKKPDNVSLFYGNVTDFIDLDIDVDCIYLDFNSSILSNKETIYKFKEKISNCKLLIVTLCKRGINQDRYENDYDIELIKNIQELTGINLNIIYGKSYNKNMITFVFENKENIL